MKRHVVLGYARDDLATTRRRIKQSITQLRERLCDFFLYDLHAHAIKAGDVFGSITYFDLCEMVPRSCLPWPHRFVALFLPEKYYPFPILDAEVHTNRCIRLVMHERLWRIPEARGDIEHLIARTLCKKGQTLFGQ